MMEIKPLIKLSNVSKYYKTKTGVSEGMRDVSLEFYNNEFVAITGESGSGKTTLLNVVSGLDSYEDGELYYDGIETSHFSVRDFEQFRAKNIGFVFQNYNVIDSYSVLDNVRIALIAQNYPSDKINERALELIEKVGLTSHKNQRTSKLSGGQKQRVVIARALAKDAPIILADEPTGNLDEKSGDEILTLLKEVSKDKLVLLVSHNLKEVDKFATRKIVMQDGSIKNDIKMESTDKTKATLNEDVDRGKSVSKGLKLAIKNLMAMPKRTIFSLILFSIIFFALIYFYSTIVVNAVESMKNATAGDYHHIVLIKRDDEEFSSSDLKSIPEARNISVSLDMDFNTIFESKLQYNFGLASSIENIIKIDGRLPRKSSEVVVKSNTRNSKDKYEIGDEITVMLKTFTVVGTIKSDRYFWDDEHVLFLYDEFVYDKETLEIKLPARVFVSNYDTFKADKLLAISADKRDLDLYKNKINKDDIQIIDESLYENYYMSPLITIVKILLWIVLIVIVQLIFFIVYQIQKNMMESRKKDFSVYRSVGINEQQVSIMILFEQLLLSVSSAVIVVTILTVGGFLSEFMYKITRNITFGNYLFISLVFAIFSLRLGQKFNKKIFDLTVIEALKEEN